MKEQVKDQTFFFWLRHIMEAEHGRSDYVRPQTTEAATMQNKVESTEWYQRLVDDCQNLLVEGEFTSRWALIETYHAVGKRILADHDNFERSQVYGLQIVSRVSSSLNKHPRTIQRAIQFARMYPDLTMLPEGKNVSWHRICNKYLTASKEAEVVEEEFLNCKQCGSQIPLKVKCDHCSCEFEFSWRDIRKK